MVIENGSVLLVGVIVRFRVSLTARSSWPGHALVRVGRRDQPQCGELEHTPSPSWCILAISPIVLNERPHGCHGAANTYRDPLGDGVCHVTGIASHQGTEESSGVAQAWRRSPPIAIAFLVLIVAPAERKSL